jgi:hypothetical protein
VRTRIVVAVVTSFVFAGALGAGGGRATSPRFDPANFVSHVTNPWFPLRPGTVFVYSGVKDGRPSRDVVTVTHARRTILGVNATVLSDRLYLSGHLGERTTDWYAQDRAGNVWYLGEETAEIDAHGHITSREGTWLAGRDGAQPGIYMPAHPTVGQSGRQEFYKGHAQDQFRVISLHASVQSPYVSSSHALLTEEWTPLEPGVLDHKLYVRGIGTVQEATVRGGVEQALLVSVHGG